MVVASEFTFVLCQAGAEAVLKRELLRNHPELSSAYQRTGLVTLRARAPLGPDWVLRSAFARCYGISLGMATNAAEVLARLPASVVAPVLHVCERPTSRSAAEVTPPYPASTAATTLAAELHCLAPNRFAVEKIPAAGQPVVTVVIASGDPMLVGLHRHSDARCPHPGGAYPVDVPADAPSRAYAKIEEAIVAFGLDMRAGDTALELGAAPGGAAYALLRRGVGVIGVDPGAMDGHVHTFVGPGGARLVHHAIKASSLTSQHVRTPVQHLLVDVHLAPAVALRGLRKALSLVRDNVRNVVWTVKLNDWAMADQLDSHVAELRALGIRDARAQQLVANRQEVCIAGTMGPRP